LEWDLAGLSEVRLRTEGRRFELQR
jgi:hypothetical protein